MLTTLYCAPQDLACLLLGAVTMLTCTTLQSCLHVVIEPSDQDLRHDANDSTLSRDVGRASWSGSARTGLFADQKNGRGRRQVETWLCQAFPGLFLAGGGLPKPRLPGGHRSQSCVETWRSLTFTPTTIDSEPREGEEPCAAD
jgi:hypothetical protein